MNLAPFALPLPGDSRIIVGGLCAPRAHEAVQAMCRAMPAPCFSDGSLSGIDCAIAALLDSLPPQSVYVAGAAAVVCTAPPPLAGYPWRTGGVIGVPGSPPEDAGETLEALENGLYLYSAPGGPGFAAAASYEQARRLADMAAAGVPAQTLLQGLRAAAGYLLVCDGTGPDAGGLLAAGAGGEEFLLRLRNPLPDGLLHES